MRSTAVPASAKQQISSAVQDLIKQLFSTTAQHASAQEPGWDKCGCYLLLRALTRSPQFVHDPGLPLLPDAAVATLQWLRKHVLGAAAPAATTPAATAPSSNGAVPAQQLGQLPAQDDKPFLLLTRLVLTATGAPTAVAAAAAASGSTGYYSAISAAVSATVVKADSANGGAIKWSDAASSIGPSADGAAGGSGIGNVLPAGASAVQDPALLVELLEWSSTKVKLALQRLLGASGDL